ncbi:MAG: hypothetical protein Q4E68_03680 [Prevotellaceae bacterium]|nr:hypothetical protein [Prevotellaceae bacterium]
MSKTIKDKISTALRIALGVCFILSGVMKAVNVYSFAQEIRLYIEAYMDTYFVQWTVEIAVVICAIETITGLLALKKKYAPVVAVIFLGMMSFFVWLTGINLFYPSLMGSIESCGCFGELIHFSPLASFVKSDVLLLMAVTNYKLLITRVVKDWKTYVTCVAGALPAVYSYLCFENMEHGVYLALYIAICIVVLISVIFSYVYRKKSI